MHRGRVDGGFWCSPTEGNVSESQRRTHAALPSSAEVQDDLDVARVHLPLAQAELLLAALALAHLFVSFHFVFLYMQTFRNKCSHVLHVFMVVFCKVSFHNDKCLGERRAVCICIACVYP